MFSNAFGLIYSGSDNWQLKDFTMLRSLASVPFGGRYRIIDFPMSNMVNSGIASVGVMTQSNYSSLIDHLGSGAPWDLNRKRDGLYLLPPFNSSESGANIGSVDALISAMDYMEHTSARYCVYQGCTSVFNTCYREVLDFHLAKKADITCLYFVDPPQRSLEDMGSGDIRFLLDEDSRVTAMEVDAKRPLSHNVFLDGMILDKQLLTYLTLEAHNSDQVDFCKDLLRKKVNELRIYAYPIHTYVGRICTVKSFFEANLDILNPKVSAQLFNREAPIWTKIKDEVPALYKSCAVVKNSMVADGCVIEGEIENCVLSRAVRIAQGAKLKNCVIMQGCEISEGVELENVILDKEVTVRRGRRLVGTESYPVSVRKLSVV